MKIIDAWPPNIEEIESLVPDVRATKGVIFAYGDAVYAPGQPDLPQPIKDHEAVHLERQAGDPATWWRRYIVDPDFRFAEELLAHRAEWKSFKRVVKNREKRAQYLAFMAARLAGPLYGRLVSTAAARAKIISA